ncbi:glycoside hydrolase family 16 protein [Salegentibacter salegens]|nr:glycoside hydrolase family 16 protein [Salegentibacter salegens]
MEWIVRKTDQDLAGPGPNYFSDVEENVWVDGEGRLHLKIRQVGGKWQCSGVSLRRSLGYGKYIFYLASDLTDLDPNVVAGLFTYMNDNEEIDIEFSQWGDPQNINAQFAVQPSYIDGNKVRFDIMPRDNNLSTHFFDWKPNNIKFGSYHGHSLEPKPDDLINSWLYNGENIPPDSNERLKINLWLFRGAAPKDMQEAELIIERVEIH